MVRKYYYDFVDHQTVYDYQLLCIPILTVPFVQHKSSMICIVSDKNTMNCVQ